MRKLAAAAVVAMLTVAGLAWVRTGARALSSTVSFTAVADAYVSSARPSRNFGAQTKLEVDGSPVVNTYLRFNVQGLTGDVVRATLEVYRVGARRIDGGHDVRSVADTIWDETSITYRNAPRHRREDRLVGRVHGQHLDRRRRHPGRPG
jgi:acid phosphatase type 7